MQPGNSDSNTSAQVWQKYGTSDTINGYDAETDSSSVQWSANGANMIAWYVCLTDGAWLAKANLPAKSVPFAKLMGAMD